MADEGIGGVFGPDWSATGGVVRSICDSLHLPHLEMHWAPSHLHDYHPFTINLYPEPKLLAKALVAVIEDMDWTSFTLIYENTDSLVRMQELLKAHDSQLISEDRVPFTVWQLGEGPDYRPLLKEIQMTSETRIVLDCSVDKILAVLHQAKQVKLMGEYHSYILTSLDAHTLDLGELKSGGTNITMLSLIDRNKYTVQSAIYDLNNPARSSIELDNKKLNLSATTIKTGSALIYDAVQLYSKAVSEMVGDSVRVAPLPCHTPGYYWKHGYSIVSRMKRSTIEGMTGKVELDEKGRRSFFTIVITELSENGQRKIGSWDPLSGITYTRTKSQMDREIYQSISNKTFIVTSRLGKPYLWTKGDNYSGNDRFEGYSIDLIDEISKDLGFKYKFVLVSDGQYGTYNKKTKQWNGLIRELRERRADLAICDLTITYDRRSAVDFTMPFMTLGISILYSKPVKTSPGLFSFLSPLSLDVWMYMATAFLGVSLVLYIGCRISPYEWENPHPCNLDSDHLECVFSLHNCLWFSIGSLTGAGCDLLPKTISTRLLAGVWWFFALIMVSSYTANLAAFLTMERMEDTIENVEDLAKQNKIKYGVLLGGSSLDFFRDSNVSTYQKMWSVMESTRPTVFVKNNDEGVERVLKGKRAYAFFMESTSIEYQVEKHCELTQVGGLLDSKGYGIAMPFNSPYRTAISGSVLKMQESGKLHELKNKWWKEKSGKTCESSKHVPLATNELGMSNVGGVFLVLIIGCTLAFLVAILEFLWQVRKVAVQEKVKHRNFSKKLKQAYTL
ncbi:hypothetical protein AAG570_011574 [Ranatra chinensis]|uniref:Glutamate receptor 1 n=1 Tax=Ranatra chinensis TaxID=642074 RepID=A0ABD0Z794_9HEMI